MSEAKAEMQAAFLIQPQVATVQQVMRPEPGSGEVLLRVRAVGICGSDMHLYSAGRIGSNVLAAPHIPGHEVSGEVVALGAGVSDLDVGRRVVVEPGLACGRCRFCRSGRYNLCPNVRFLGIPPHHGGMAEFMAVPAQWVHVLPDELSFVEGAVIEPLAVGLQAAEQGAVGPESSVAIFGAGPIGLVALEAALARGARQVYVVDVLERRLRLAEELGATAALNAAALDAADEIRRLTGGWGADVVIEATGSPRAISQAFRSASRGATAVLVGIAEAPLVSLDYTSIVRSGIRMETVFRYVNQFPLALDLASRGRARLSPLVTHTFPLSEAPSAFFAAHTKKDEVVKAVVVV